MIWDLATECTACVFVCIIYLYSREGNLVPSLKNKIFNICILTTFFSIVFNLASTAMLYNFKVIPVPLTWSVTLIYFLLTPLMGTVYFYYTIATIYENEEKKIKNFFLWGSIPYLIYILIVILSSVTQSIFYIDPVLGYMRGEYIGLTYIIFYLYCFLCFVPVVLNWKNIDSSIRKVLVYFLILAAGVVVIQQYFSTLILSGSAAACALLIIYLYLQNKQSSVDGLTGLLNREEFSRMLALKVKDRNKVFTVIVLSVNNFKFVNDKFGQEKGNLVLKNIGDFLKEIGKNNRLYRYGGDQFAILLEKNNASDAGKLLNNIIEKFKEPMEISDFEYRISLSIGVVEYPHVAGTMEDVINGIEYTITQVKKLKQTQYCYCTEEMLDKVKRKNKIIEILNQSLLEKKFEVYFQPIWSIKKKKFTYAEALLRLNDTTLGPISPGEFIPVAEETGIIVNITYEVLDQICKFIRKVMDEGRNIEGVSINMPFIQIMQKDLKEKMLKIIKENNIPTNKIKVEITEGALIEDFDLVRDFIFEMGKEGIKFGLDDFGTGYSNISSVLQIPFQVIKLDKSLLDHALEKPDSGAFMIYVTKAIQEMGMEVIAEGIETEEQSRFIEYCQCDHIQGFFYKKTLPGKEAISSFEYEVNI